MKTPTFSSINVYDRVSASLSNNPIEKLKKQTESISPISNPIDRSGIGANGHLSLRLSVTASSSMSNSANNNANFIGQPTQDDGSSGYGSPDSFQNRYRSSSSSSSPRSSSSRSSRSDCTGKTSGSNKSYFVHNNLNHHHNHHQQQQQKQSSVKPKECFSCHKPILERYFLKALDHIWHEDCLKCSCCNCRLGEIGSTLFTKADLILCKRDYLRMFGATGFCSLCNKQIPAFEMVMRARGQCLIETFL
ncbi:Lim domain protein 1 [Sarcoptes scabiei]|uniref:Lim domain protein 1 n=1 Tax=Sarcoptes scabiei TaxID=52283 RepID=A0A132A9H1_SARSC|nr:Lim domain protein 1 [Sarcoptes scabiei]